VQVAHGTDAGEPGGGSGGIPGLDEDPSAAVRSYDPCLLEQVPGPSAPVRSYGPHLLEQVAKGGDASVGASQALNPRAAEWVPLALCHIVHAVGCHEVLVGVAQTLNVAG
jgi:hypothetical protein